MAVCYNNLWKLLIDKNMNKTELKEAAGISFNVMARMGKNETISFESIEKICAALQCNIGDIIEIVQDNHEEASPKTFTTIELFAGAADCHWEFKKLDLRHWDSFNFIKTPLTH